MNNPPAVKKKKKKIILTYVPAITSSTNPTLFSLESLPKRRKKLWSPILYLCLFIWVVNPTINWSG